jgi:hypothetical protein
VSSRGFRPRLWRRRRALYDGKHHTQKGGLPFTPGELIAVKGTIRVYRTAAYTGECVARASVGTSGRFRIPLPPGRYGLGARLPCRSQLSCRDDAVSLPFEVTADRFVHVNVTIVPYIP